MDLREKKSDSDESRKSDAFKRDYILTPKWPAFLRKVRALYLHGMPDPRIGLSTCVSHILFNLSIRMVLKWPSGRYPVDGNSCKPAYQGLTSQALVPTQSGSAK
jgi:hypothetical protein